MPPRQKKAPRAFDWRAGIQIAGTHVTCDTTGSISDLVFLSHAQALPAVRLARRHAGRQELLTTQATLALLGPVGERLRPQVLPAPFGRPFTLGGLRLELFPSGHSPGAASLLVEFEGRSRLYAGAVCRPDPAFGATPAEVRRAEAICLDATYGHPRFVFPPRLHALEQLRAFVDRARAAGRGPVILCEPHAGAMDAASALDGLGLRGHRAIVATASAYRLAGVAAPAIARFSRALGADEVLLWPPGERLPVLAAPAVLLASPLACDADAVARLGVEAAVPLTNQMGHAGLLAYLEATGAREVALHRGFAEPFAAELRERGHDAYALGPPRQMDLLGP